MDRVAKNNEGKLAKALYEESMEHIKKKNDIT